MDRSHGLRVGRWLTIPLAEIELQTSRSSGPGGQHANVTDSRVEAVFVAAGAEPTSAASPALEGLRRGHDQLVERVIEPRLKPVFCTICR